MTSKDKPFSVDDKIKSSTANRPFQGDLLSQLEFILNDVFRIIPRVEKKYPHKFKKFWGPQVKSATSSKSITERSIMFYEHRVNVFRNDDSLIYAYWGLITAFHQIYRSLHSIGKGETSVYNEIVSDNNLIDKLFEIEKYDRKKFNDDVVHVFFKLQRSYIDLYDIEAGRKKIIPFKFQDKRPPAEIDLSINYGEEVLMARISDFIQKQDISIQYQKLDDLFEGLRKGFARVLKKYKSDVKKQYRVNGRILMYAGPLNPDGLKRKFIHWRKNDEFKFILERIYKIRTSKRHPIIHPMK